MITNVARKRMMRMNETLINSNYIRKEKEEGRTTDTDSRIITFHRDNNED